MRRLVSLAALAISLAFPLAGLAQTTEVAGAKFPNSVQVGDSKLVINGAGVRYKLVFQVYAAALYLTEKASTPEAAINAQGPRRLSFVLLREIDANELGKLFTRGIEQNAPREEFSKSISGILRMSDIFSKHKKLAPGDTFLLEWVPGAGTLITVNGKAEHPPVKEPEFYSALMKIWLGKTPADAQLKEALLGRAPPPAGSTNYNN